MWHAQGFWVQMMIMICFSWTFFEKPRYKLVNNLPLGLINLYVGLHVGYFVFVAGMARKYDTAHFFPYFNLICLLILYHIIIQYINKKQIVQILNILRYVIITTLIVTTLQIFRLTEFMEMLYDGDKFANNPAVGFLGNGTHLSGFLASCTPLFFWKFKREDIFALFLTLLILTYTGTASNDPAISGFIIFTLLWIYYFKKNFHIIVPTMLLLPMFGYIAYRNMPPVFWNTSGRLPLWSNWIKVFMLKPWTGIGLGGINLAYMSKGLKVRHLHLEFFHYLVELGLPILILIVNLVKQIFGLKAENRLELTLKALVIGFLISCCFNFPSHLWLPSTWAMFFYAAFYALKRRGIEDVVETRDSGGGCTLN